MKCYNPFTPSSLYKKKPAEYMGHLIGHEGEGSVLSALRYRRWATGVSAGVHGLGYNSSSCCSMFCVTFYLTKVNMENDQYIPGP